MPNIELSIDELVLHGFPAQDRARIGDAVHTELVRMLSGMSGDTSKLASLGRVPSLDAGSFEVASSSPRAIGNQIARNIVTSVGGGRSR
jgi:methionine aminopeptidase